MTQQNANPFADVPIDNEDAGMSAEQIAVELCADLVNTDPLLYCPATVRKITQRIEAYADHLRGEVARLTRERDAARDVMRAEVDRSYDMADVLQKAEAELARLRQILDAFTWAFRNHRNLGKVYDEARAVLASTTPQEEK